MGCGATLGNSSPSAITNSTTIIGVNLLQAGESVDLFVANDTDAGDFLDKFQDGVTDADNVDFDNTEPSDGGWIPVTSVAENNTFNGDVLQPESGDFDIFARVKADAAEIDTGSEIDWTLTQTATDREINFDEDDPFNPNQTTVLDSALKGQTVIDDSDEGNTLEGGSGPDFLYGNGGDDTLFGEEHHDVLSGGDGDDILNGDVGDDLLIGGDGADILSGGAGKDIYKFTEDPGSNVDSLTDFSISDNDVLDISEIVSFTDGGGEDINDFITIDDTGVVKVDADGTGVSESFTQVATLETMPASGLNVIVIADVTELTVGVS